MTILKSNASKLRQLLFVFYHQFLSASTAGVYTENRLRKQSRRVFIIMRIAYSSALICTLQIVVLPLIRGSKELPLNIAYGFNVRRSPEYEIMYSLQAIHLLLSVMQGITAHDDLFFVFCWNTIAQFILLKERVLKVSKDKFARDRLKTCVQHHNISLRY